jgi:hypothetical protein
MYSSRVCSGQAAGLILCQATNLSIRDICSKAGYDRNPIKKKEIMLLNRLLKKSLLNRPFKNPKCKEQKKFKVAAYLGYVRV